MIGEIKMKNKLIELFAWIYSLSATLWFLRISLEGIFRQKHNIKKHNKSKRILQNKGNENCSNN